jgi:hypothetical protein
LGSGNGTQVADMSQIRLCYPDEFFPRKRDYKRASGAAVALQSEPFASRLGLLVTNVTSNAMAYHKRLYSSNNGETCADYNLWLNRS